MESVVCLGTSIHFFLIADCSIIVQFLLCVHIFLVISLVIHFLIIRTQRKASAFEPLRSTVIVSLVLFLGIKMSFLLEYEIWTCKFCN